MFHTEYVFKKSIQSNDDDCGPWICVFASMLACQQRASISNLAESFLREFKVREQILIYLLRGKLENDPPLRYFLYHQSGIYISCTFSEITTVMRAIDEIKRQESENKKIVYAVNAAERKKLRKCKNQSECHKAVTTSSLS